MLNSAQPVLHRQFYRANYMHVVSYAQSVLHSQFCSQFRTASFPYSQFCIASVAQKIGHSQFCAASLAQDVLHNQLCTLISTPIGIEKSANDKMDNLRNIAYYCSDSEKITL